MVDTVQVSILVTSWGAKMKYSLLASGSKGNCCIIENADTKIVIDCGTTKKYLTQRMNEIDVSIHDLDALLITHTHGDHISQIKMFKSLLTYGESDLDAEHQIRITANQHFNISSMHIQSIRLSHDSACLGYILEDADSKLVYVTDTGYLKEEYYGCLSNADYYIFESNHDVGVLMKTARPAFVKQRIINDYGHLCNEDSAKHLAVLIGPRTKEIVLAHISEEGNTRELAVEVLRRTLSEKGVDHSKIKVSAAPQFEMTQGGVLKEKECVYDGKLSLASALYK